MITNKRLNPIVTELFIRGRKLNISIVFITQSYFKVPKDVRLNSTHFFIMKIPNKRELQQIALNHSSDIDFKDFMKIYKKFTKEPYSFLVNNTTLPSDDTLRFRKNLLKTIYNKIMTTEDKIKDEKLQYDINREEAKISALSSGKIDKYEYLTGEEILPSNQQQIIEQAKFAYSPLGKAFEKQTKTIEEQAEKQTKPNEYGDYFLNGLAKIRESSMAIDFNNSTYFYKGNSAPIKFIGLEGQLNIFKNIYKGEKTLEDIEKEQVKFRRYLGDIKQGNPKKKDQKNNKKQ